MKVNLKEKIVARIPLEITGTPLAVSDGKGTLNISMNEIEVEALPTELPEKVELSVDELKEVGDHILVQDLKLPKEVEVKNDPQQTVVSITELAKEEVEEPPAEEGVEGDEESKHPEEEPKEEKEQDSPEEAKEQKE